MSDHDGVPTLELRASTRTWVLGGISLAFAVLTLFGEPVPLITLGWFALGGYFTARAVRGRLFLTDGVLWQRSAFTDKRLVGLDELADVVTHQTWPLKQTVVLVDQQGRRAIVRLVEWRDPEPLLVVLRDTMGRDGRSLNPIAAEWFESRLG